MRGTAQQPSNQRDLGATNPGEAEQLRAGRLRASDRRILGVATVVVLAVIASGILVMTGSDEQLVTSAASVPSSIASRPAATGSAAPSLQRPDAVLLEPWTGTRTSMPPKLRAPVAPTQFSVSPNRTSLAFVSGDEIYVSRADGTGMRRVADIEGASAPSWSPDGTHLVYTDGERIFTVRVDGGATRRLTGSLGQVWRPNYSPDGRTILFTRAIRELRSGPIDLWTVPASGGDPTVLLRLPGHHNAAFGVYGPDGTIAYRRTSYDGVTITAMTEDRIWIAEADGSDRRIIGRGGSWMSQIDPESLWPAWSPDGTKIAYEYLYSQGVRIVDVSTGRVWGSDGHGTHPVWVDDATLIVEGLEGQNR